MPLTVLGEGNCTKCGGGLPMIQRNDGQHPDCKDGVRHEVLRKQADGSWK